jgi:hypothetical protein
MKKMVHYGITILESIEVMVNKRSVFGNGWSKENVLSFCQLEILPIQSLYVLVMFDDGFMIWGLTTDWNLKTSMLKITKRKFGLAWVIYCLWSYYVKTRWPKWDSGYKRSKLCTLIFTRISKDSEKCCFLIS